MFKRIIVVLLIGLLAWAYQITHPPPPNVYGSPSGPHITAPRIKLRDVRHLAYKEHGVPKEIANYKIILVHGFGSSRHDARIATLGDENNGCGSHNWDGTKVVVAEGTIASTDSKALVHHVPLGPGCWKVWVNRVIVNAPMFHPNREMFMFEDAIGSTVAWLTHFISLDFH